MRRRPIGALLKACRERAGLTQQELADILMKDVSFISRVENGKQIPDAETYNDWISATNGGLLMYVYVFGDDGTKVLQTVS